MSSSELGDTKLPDRIS